MINERSRVRRPPGVLQDRAMVVMEIPVALDVLGEEPQGGGDRRKGQVEPRDLVEREEGDLLRLGARGEVQGGFPFPCSAAALHELAAEEEVGLPDRGDVLFRRERSGEKKG